MADFNDWCTLGTLVPIGGHQATVLESYDDAKVSATLAASLPNAYANSDSLAMVAERFGKEGVAEVPSQQASHQSQRSFRGHGRDPRDGLPPPRVAGTWSGRADSSSATIRSGQ